MAIPSKTVMDLDIEKRIRKHSHIEYAIKEHERKHHKGFWSFGVSPSKSLPPQKQR